MAVISLRFAGVCLPESPGGLAVGGVVLQSGADRFLGYVVADDTRRSCQAMADWAALWVGLDQLRRMLAEGGPQVPRIGARGDELQIRSASQLVINQMLNRWRTNVPRTQAYRAACQAILLELRQGGALAAVGIQECRDHQNRLPLEVAETGYELQAEDDEMPENRLYSHPELVDEVWELALGEIEAPVESFDELVARSLGREAEVRESPHTLAEIVERQLGRQLREGPQDQLTLDDLDELSLGESPAAGSDPARREVTGRRNLLRPAPKPSGKKPRLRRFRPPHEE